MEFITLNNGVKMPLEGFGVFQVPDAAICEQAVTEAIAAGYRLIDTAAAYYNEEAVGAAIAKSNVPREKLFITTKLWVQDASYEAAQKAIDTSLQKLGLNYLDLYLIHQPMGDYVGAYRAMEEAYHAGKLRAIGVSNFYPARLADLCETVSVIPAVNQVALRWNVQRGVVVIPKSVKAERMAQNFDIWNFTLSAEDMAEIAKLDIGHSEIVDHNNPDFVKMLHQLKVHD